MNSLSFCFSGTIFIALLVLKVRYAIYGILYWQLFFSFRTLNISHPSSAALKVSAENSADTLTEGSLCVASHSFLDAFKTQ